MNQPVQSSPILLTQGFSIELMFELFDEFKRALKNRAFQNAKAILARMQTNVPALRASISRMRNTITSVQEGLDSGALTPAQAGSELNDELREFEDNYRGQISKLANHERESFDEDLKTKIRPGSTDVFVKDKDTLQRALLKSGVYVGYCPVLAIGAPPFSPAKLNRVGIPSGDFAGYTILKKQFVAGLSLDYINAHLPAPEGRPSKKKDTEAKETLIEEFKEILLTRHRNLRLSEVAAPISWYGAMWFWFVSAAEYKAWQSGTISTTSVNSVSIKKWSFPF